MDHLFSWNKSNGVGQGMFLKLDKDDGFLPYIILYIIYCTYSTFNMCIIITEFTLTIIANARLVQ